MNKLILLILFLLSACSGREQEMTLAEAERGPSYGSLDLTSRADPITRISFLYINSESKTLHIDIPTISRTELSVSIPEIRNYNLISMTLTIASNGLIFFDANEQCRTINGMPVMLRLDLDDYSTPVLMVPHLKDNHFCLIYNLHGGHTY